MAHGHHHHHHHNDKGNKDTIHSHGSKGDVPNDAFHAHLKMNQMPDDAFHQHLKKVHSTTTSLFTHSIDTLFPLEQSPMIYSFLATFYISFFPNILLLFVPSHIKASTLNILVSFAVGGLLGDVFLHLIPHAFLDSFEKAKTMTEEEAILRNVCVGVAIFFGIIGFFILEKFMYILSGKKGHDHSHNHSHEHDEVAQEVSEKKNTNRKGNESELRQRKVKSTSTNQSTNQTSNQTSTLTKQVNLAAYLNLIADFSHNFTDGLAIAASFYIDRTIGISTTIAVFFHEIPHEIGDFAILLQKGFTRMQAIYAQFFTALGALLGTVAGVVIQEALKVNSDQVKSTSKLFNVLPIEAGDLVLPITAGGFLYIATVSVIPELLETPEDLKDQSENKFNMVWQLLKELIAMMLGVFFMALVSIYE